MWSKMYNQREIITVILLGNEFGTEVVLAVWNRLARARMEVRNYRSIYCSFSGFFTSFMRRDHTLS